MPSKNKKRKQATSQSKKEQEKKQPEEPDTPAIQPFPEIPQAPQMPKDTAPPAIPGLGSIAKVVSSAIDQQEDDPNTDEDDEERKEMRSVFQGIVDNHVNQVQEKYDALKKHCDELQRQRDEIVDNYNKTSKKLSTQIQQLQQQNGIIYDEKKKKQRELIHQREDLKNKLLHEEHEKQMKIQEARKKDTRIQELMDLLKTLKDQVQEFEAENNQLKVDVQKFKAQIDKLGDLDDLNNRLKINLAKAQADKKALDKDNDNLAHKLKDALAAKEGLKKKCNDLQKKGDEIQKALDAIQKHSDADNRTHLLEKELIQLEHGILLALDDTDELNEKLAHYSELTPEKQPQLKAKFISIGKDLKRDLLDLQESGKKILNERADMRKQLERTRSKPHQCKDPEAISRKADELNETIKEYNDALGLARSKLIPDFKKNVDDMHDILIKEMRDDCAKGFNQGKAITTDRDKKLRQYEKHVNEMKDKVDNAFPSAKGDKLKVLQKLSKDIREARQKLHKADSQNILSNKLLDYVKYDSDNQKILFDAMTKVRYEDLPRALQAARDAQRISDFVFDDIDEIAKILDATLLNRADQLLKDLKNNLNTAQPKKLDQLNNKLNTLDTSVKGVQGQIDKIRASPLLQENPQAKKELDQVQKQLNDPFKKLSGELQKRFKPHQAELAKLTDKINKADPKKATIVEIAKFNDDVDKYDDAVTADEKQAQDLIDKLKGVKDGLTNRDKQNELMVKLQDDARKIDTLGKKNQATKLLGDKEKPLTAGERDLLHLQDKLKETEEKLRDMKKLTGPKILPGQKKKSDEVVAIARKQIDKSKVDLSNIQKKLQPIKQKVASVDPKSTGHQKANQILTKSGQQLKVIEPQIFKTIDGIASAQKKVKLARDNVNDLQNALKIALTDQADKGLKSNDKILAKAAQTMVKCDEKIIDLKKKANSALTHVPPKSDKAKKLNGYRADLEDKTNVASNIKARKYKEDSDQKRMKERLGQKPGLEPLVKLCEDVEEGDRDAVGVDKDATQLYESLRPIEVELNKDAILNAKLKLDDLKNKLNDAKKDANDVDTKCQDFERQAGDLDDALASAQEGTKDPQMKKKVDDARKQLKDPLQKEEEKIKKENPRSKADLQKLEEQIKKLDPNNPNPDIVDDISDNLDRVDDKIKADQAKIDDLRNKLHPLDKLADQAHKALGDVAHGVERDAKGCQEDLKSLDKKLDDIKKKCKINDKALESMKQDKYKDKEKENQLADVVNENNTEKGKLQKQLADRDSLRKELDQCRQEIEKAKTNPSMIDTVHKKVQDLNKKVDVKVDIANQLDTDVQETKQKIDIMVKKYDEKKRYIDSLKERANIQKVELEDLVGKKAPPILERLKQLDQKIKSHPVVVDPKDQAALDQVKKDIIPKLKEAQSVPIEGQKLVEQDKVNLQVLDEVPNKVVKYENLNAVASKLDKITNDRKILEEKLKDANDFLTQANHLIDPILLKDEMQKQNQNRHLSDDVQKKIDKATDQLKKLNKQIDDVHTKADEAVQSNPNMKNQADKAKKEAVAIKKRGDELQKVKKNLQSRLNDVKKQDNPKTVDGIRKDLQALDKQAKDVNDELDKLYADADFLDNDFDQAKEHKDKQNKLNDDANYIFKNNDELEKKLKKLKTDVDGMEQLQRAIQDNPDYELSQPENLRLREKLEEMKVKSDRVHKDKIIIDKQVPLIKAKLPKIPQMSMKELDQEMAHVVNYRNKLQQLTKEVDEMQSSLDKKRVKIGNAQIPKNVADKRPFDIKGVEEHLKNSGRNLQSNKDKVKSVAIEGMGPSQAEKKVVEDQQKLNKVIKQLQ